MRKLIKSFIFGALGVSLMLWESVIYRPSKYFFEYLDRLKLFAALEEKIKALPLFLAVPLLVAPALVLTPFKLFAMYSIAHHQYLLGTMTFILAKATGGFLFVRIFDLVEPTLRKNQKINNGLNLFFGWKNALVAHVKGTRIYLKIAAVKRSVTIKAKQVVRSFKRKISR